MKLADEVMENFNDGSHILYVNSAIQDDTELGRLMHDLTCRDPDKMYSPILAERVRELKETQKGVEIMCREMDKIFNEGVELGEERGFERGEKRGFERGKMEAKQETVLSMAEMGISPEQIAKAVKENVKLEKKWISERMTIAKP